MKSPEIMNYSSAHIFLKDYYKYRKQKTKSFSFASWSREILYPHRSNLRLVVTGKRGISQIFEKCLKEKMFKTAKERAYFSALCELSREKKANRKEVLVKKVYDLTRQKEVRVSLQNGALDDIWESLLLILILGFKDVDHSLDGLAKILCQDKSLLLNRLLKLEKLDLVGSKVTANGGEEWSAKGAFTIFDDDKGNEKLATYHRQSFHRAIAAQSLPKKSRRFDSLILPLLPKEYDQFCEDLKQFLDQQYYKYSSDTLNGKDVYQLQMGLFPALRFTK